MNGNPSSTLLSGSPFSGSQTFVTDTTAPGLVSFGIDMEAGTVALTFDESIDSVSLQATGMTLQTAMWASGAAYSANHTLTGGSVTVLSSTTLELALLTADVQRLKALDLCLGAAANCTLSAAGGFVQDLALSPNEALAISRAAALNASAIVADVTSPRIAAFTLDVDVGTLLVTFNEPVRGESFDPTGLTVQAARTSAIESVTLTGGAVSLVRAEAGDVGSRVVRVDLLQDDTVSLKLNLNLATAQADTYLSATNATVQDMSGNWNAPVPTNDARPSSVYQRDETPAALVSYELDMLAGTLSLTFSDVVDVSTLRVQSIALVNAGTSYALQSSTTNSTDGLYVVIDLSVEDLLGVLRVPGLARTRDTTFLTMDATALDDFAGLDVAVVTSDSPQQALAFVADTAAPALVSFDFNLTAGDLALTFSEPVNASTVDFARIQLRAAANATDAALTLSLTGGALTQSADDRVLYVRMTAADFLALQAKRALATNASTTFVFVDGLLDDYFGNTLAAADATAQQVAVFGEDTRAPTLVSVSLDLDARTMSMVFSETMDSASFEPSVVRFACGNATSFRSGTHATLSIAAAEASAIQAQAGVVSNVHSVVVLVSSDLAQDTAGNQVRRMAGVEVQIVLDQTSPAIASLSMDLNIGDMTVRFDEPIMEVSLNASCIAVQSLVNASLPAVLLANSSAETLYGQQEALVTLGPYDLNQLKGLVWKSGSANLSAQICVAFGVDLAQNPSVSRTLNVTVSSLDETAPEVISASLNLTSGIVQLVIDEPVVATSLDVTKLEVGGGIRGSVVRLNASTLLHAQDSALRTVLQLRVPDLVLDQLKFLVAGSEGDVVIGIESGAMVDASDNEIQASVGNDSVAFSQIAVDTAAPAISEFRVNLNASTISISMTEPIDASAGILTDKLRLLVDNVLLLRPQRMPVSVSNYARSLTFTLSSDDANLVKAALARAGLVSTIQLTAEPSFCVDLFSNALQRISTPLNASVVVSDVSAPNLLQFGYDNGRGLVRLQFSEPVDLSTVNISAAALTNANGSFTVGLENSTILGSNNNTWVTLKLANAEHWTVQTTAAIGSDVNSTFLLVPNATIVKDVFGNALVAEDLRGGVRVQATFVVPDTVAPSLVSGSLNMATGVLQLRLSEPVSIDSFNLTRLVLHNSKNRDDSTAKLVLSDSVALRSVTQPTEVKVALSQRELDAVKVDRTLAVNTSTAWFTLEAGAVQDYAKVPNERTEGLLIAELVPDSVKPVLVASYLNMTSLELALIFSEPVASRSINTSLISLAGDRGVPAARTVTLAGASVVGQLLSRRAMINLHGHVAFAIQADLGVATSRNDSVLRLAEGFVIDTSGNAIAFQEAVVTDFTPDERAPLATAAALDLDALTLNITFDEVVRTCNLTSIFVSDAENASSAGRVPLVGSNASFSLNILRVELSQAVANALKSHETVCRSPTSCYVVLGRGSVADASENQVADVQPVLVLPYVQDRTPPTITAFALDVEAGELRLRFDEPVDVSAANASLSSLNMSLQSVPSASFAPSPLVVNLRSPLSVQAVGGLFGQRYALEMNVSIARSVIDDVKRAYPLASSTQQTFLAVGGGAFRDARGNPSNAIDAEKALVVERLHPDLVAPVLLATSIDFAAESIVLTFDEPVNSSSLALAGISAIGGLGRVALQVTDVQPAHGTVVVEATLADESLAWLKLSAVELQQGGVAVELRTGAIRDWNGNQVRQTAQALKLDSADSTASRLLAFNVTWTDENVGVTLVFDEPVNTTTLGLESVLTLSNCSRDGSQISTVVHAAALHGGFVPGGNESSAVFVSGANATSIRYEQDGVAIAIADSMAEEMQFARVCLARDACCLGLTAGFVQNHFRVASAPVSLNETARPSVLEPDVSRPTLVGFVVLDLNSRELVLSFSEPMDETSLNATQLKLEGAAFPGHTSDVLVLSEPERVDVGASGTLLTLTLSLEDAAGIKLRSSLCVSAASCWLRLMDGAIMDASGNAVVGIEPSTASDPERDTPLLVLDNTGPSVLEFSLNLDAGTFGVRFDEPVARDSIDSRLGSISANGNSTSWDVQLRGSVLSSSADLRSFTLSLEEGDANGIKALAAAGLCTTPASCFLRTDNGFAADVFGNDNSAQSAVPVGTLIGDATGPELTEVALLDLTRGILELEFNEPVNASSLDVSRIVLVNATAGGSAPASFVGSLRLSEAPLRVSYRDGATKTGLVVALSSAQLEAISTRLDIAVSQDTSYAFMDAGAVQDMAGNLLANRTSALACTSYVSAGRASIVGVELDLDEGVLKLTLSAAVSAQSLRAEELRLQNVGDADAATQAGTLVSHTLLAASSNTNSRDGFSVTVILAEEDLNAIKGQRALATSRNNTFLVASGEALTGLDGAAILAVVRGAALQATRVVADGTPPALVGFNFSRELGVIDLSFSEVVDVAMLNASALTLTATNATDTASFTVPAGSRVSVPAGANVGSGALQATVKLSEQALWALKTTQGVGEAIASSRLVAAAGFVADMAGNRMVALARRSALVATAFEGDATPPELLSFNLNMTALLLTLNMSEPVPRASLQEQHVALLASATAPIGVTLDGGVVGVELSAYDTIVTVKLSAELADAIHSVPGLCLSADSCFLSAGSAAATDTAANALVATTGLRVSVFARDSRAPVLLGFELDMTAEVLVLTFDKVLNTTELARRYVTLPSSVILQSNDTALTLSGSRVVDAGVSRRVNITLSSNDAFQVQLSDGIGRTTADTFLALNAGTGLTDVSGNEVLATGALQAKTVRADTRRPRLVSYEVDMTLGSLVLVFTEPVRVSSVDATALTLVGAGGGRNVTLRGGNVRGDNGLRIELRMTRGDLDAVKASGGLFANASNTGLLMAAHLCDDMAGNALEPVLAPLQASAFVQDVNQPLLVEFDLNMNSRVLTLVFNESVDVGTLNVSAIVLEPNSSSAAAGSGHRLQGGHVAGTDVLARRIDVALESADVDVLTQKRIAVSRERAWLSHASGLVQDRAGRRAVARGSEGSGVSALGALLCANFTTDTTAPVLVDFTLSLTSNELWLTFSETVVGASLDLSRVVLQNVTNATANTFPVVTTVTTANGPVRVVSGNELRFEAVRLGSGSQVADGQPWAFPVLRVELAFEDVERLRASLSLAVSRESTFLRYDAEAFSDVFAQRAGALTADEAAACGAFERDGVAPRVVAVGVDLSQRGHANVTLEFSETVDVQSLQVTAISFLNITTGALDAGAVTLRRAGTGVQQEGGFILAGYGRHVSLSLSAADLQALQLRPSLVATQNRTLVQVAAGAVTDTAGNAISATEAFVPVVFLSDESGPVLDAFELDMDDGVLVLTFDEVVAVDTFDVSAVVLLSNASVDVVDRDGRATSNETWFRLTPDSEAHGWSGSSLSADLLSTQIAVVLGADDLNELKARRSVASNAATSVLVLAAGAVADGFGNTNEAIHATRNLQPARFVADVTGPVLRRFALDMNEALLEMTFDEPVLASSLNASLLVIQGVANSALAGATQLRLGTNGTKVSYGATALVLRMALADADVYLLKARGGLATARASTYLRADAGFVRDTASNAAVGTPHSTALGVSSDFVADSVPPALLRFTFDLDSAVVQLTFSEPVASGTLDATKMFVAGAPLSTGGDTGYRAASETAGAEYVEMHVLRVDLTGAFIGTLKLDAAVATAQENTWLVGERGFVRDMQGNQADPEAGVMAAGYHGDDTRPSVAGYVIDMTSGMLTLTFDDVVNARSFDRSGLSFVPFSDEGQSGGGGTDQTSVVALEP
ncbi:hypothetical protein PTSG_12324 [Salpingoeca rosetta]|uniref:Uncharacterized protein n=1 Tax=Salpingoeca rosetta (strain ATCC 50818 / BSB-021) TaxID=946362 RepID=F2UBC0_SALR5|nr:uncharacterized protein PTSG_12324 [Salpingoeca rosetta]EGD73786.1 hypothetical protein PTSG_12324 [Salpingoeca rosetta]|eukprot:XP_004993349.1 hypothetical protein PTSG_12324 [Salpingoeca rosetta]